MKFEKGFDPEQEGAKYIEDNDVYIYTKDNNESPIFGCLLVDGKRKCVEIDYSKLTKETKLTDDARYRMILTPLKKNEFLGWECEYPSGKTKCKNHVAKEGDLCAKHKRMKRVFSVTHGVYHDFSPYTRFVGTYSSFAKAREAAMEYVVSMIKDGFNGWEVGINEEGDSLEGYRNTKLTEYVEINQQDVL